MIEPPTGPGVRGGDPSDRGPGGNGSEPERGWSDFSREQVRTAWFFTILAVFVALQVPVTLTQPPSIVERVLLTGALLAFLGILAATTFWARVRVGIPRRIRGTTLELSRPFLPRRRLDLSTVRELAAGNNGWVDTSGRYGSFFYEWRLLIAHPDGIAVGGASSPDGWVNFLTANGCPPAVAERWVAARERVILFSCVNDDSIEAAIALRNAARDSGATIDPSFDRTLGETIAVFDGNSPQLARLKWLRRTRWRPWLRFRRRAATRRVEKPRPTPAPAEPAPVPDRTAQLARLPVADPQSSERKIPFNGLFLLYLGIVVKVAFALTIPLVPFFWADLSFGPAATATVVIVMLNGAAELLVPVRRIHLGVVRRFGSERIVLARPFRLSKSLAVADVTMVAAVRNIRDQRLLRRRDIDVHRIWVAHPKGRRYSWRDVIAELRRTDAVDPFETTKEFIGCGERFITFEVYQQVDLPPLVAMARTVVESGGRLGSGIAGFLNRNL